MNTHIPLPPPPHLPTLEHHPSWCNCHGRIDRSACVEITARQAKRLMLDPWYSLTPDTSQTTHHACGLALPPDHPTPSPPQGRTAFTRITLTTSYINQLQRRRNPRRLNGDYRPLARAMRPDPLHPHTLLSTRGNPIHRPNQLNKAPGPDHGLPANPNRGACCEKTLALPTHWSQSLVLEQWLTHTFQPGDRWGHGPSATTNRTLHFHSTYLVCPAHPITGTPHHAPSPFNPTGAYHPTPTPSMDATSNACGLAPSSLTSGGAGPLYLPPTATPPDAARHLTYLQRKKARISLVNCNYHPKKDERNPCRTPVTRRCRALYMILGTPQELKDAAAAQLWLDRCRQLQPHEPWSPLQLQILNRYGPLFGPRRFLCRSCLNLAYGALNLKQLPENRRNYFIQKKPHERPTPGSGVERGAANACGLTGPGARTPRSVRRIDRLAKKARRAIDVADIWMARLAALEAETNPAKAMDLIQRYYVNPINNRRHPLKHVRWTKALDPYKPKNRTAAAANPPSSKP